MAALPQKRAHLLDAHAVLPNYRQPAWNQLENHPLGTEDHRFSTLVTVGKEFSKSR